MLTNYSNVNNNFITLTTLVTYNNNWEALEFGYVTFQKNIFFKEFFKINIGSYLI